jgi:nucleoside phosphorylase
MIAAALSEELQTALDLCTSVSKSRTAGIPVWTGQFHSRKLNLVKLGAGPVRAAAGLEKAIRGLKPRAIFIIGYGGALDPALRFGDLVAIDSARPYCEKTWGAPLEEIDFGPAVALADPEGLLSATANAGLPIRCGATLTSKCVLGDPLHKAVLFRRFGAAVVDMETAFLAKIAADAGIPLHCIRAISDEADDDLFSFLSYHPGQSRFRLAAQTIAAGHLADRARQWRERSRAARANLARFLSAYLKNADVLS